MNERESKLKTKEYNLFNFNFIKKHSVEYYQPKKIYIISKKNFDEGIKYLDSINKENEESEKKTEKKEYKNEINFFNKENFQRVRNKKFEFSIVTEEFLISLNIEKDNYKNKSVNFYEIESKKYLAFQDGSLFEISDLEVKDKNNKEILEGDKVLDPKDLILKILILIYANEKEILKLLKLPIEDEYDIKEYYLIYKSWINDYKRQANYDKICQVIEEMKINLVIMNIL